MAISREMSVMRWALGLSVGLGPGPVIADEDVVLDEVHVHGQAAPPPNASPQLYLDAETLARESATTLGATLARQPGVSNASFGAGVGQPVIRGLTGTRVKLLGNGIGSNDVSAASPDHVVTLESVLADRIEVLRGPATVLYGSSAMGGAVNVVDGRIPEAQPEYPIQGRLEQSYDFAHEERLTAARVDAGYGIFALHADGLIRSRADTQIPGLAVDEASARQVFGDDVRIDNNVGSILNSALDSHSRSVGVSLTPEFGYLGVAIQNLDYDYGIPSGGLPAHAHGNQASSGLSDIDIAVQQERLELKGEWFSPVKLLDALKVHIQDSRYQHDELDSGRLSTRFSNDVLESRFTALHRLAPNWSGELGLHHLDREFSAVGEESFVPLTHTQMLAGFVTTDVNLDPLKLEFGLRREFTEHLPQERALRTVAGLTVAQPENVDFRTLTGTGALQLRTGPVEWRLSYSHVERAPDVQELLALGPHFATRSFDVGDRSLQTETARTIDLGLSFEQRRYGLKLNLFQRDIDDFIFLGFDPRLAVSDPASGSLSPLLYNVETDRLQAFCTVITDCLPVYAYQQQDARFLGFEASLHVALAQWRGIKLGLNAQADAVRGYFRADGRGDVPRLPPLRYGLSLVAEQEGRFRGELAWLRATDQERAGLLEPATAGYDDLRLQASYFFKRDPRGEVEFFIHGNNLLDEDIRLSTSFLRSFSPEPGQSVMIGVRMRF